MTDEMKARKVTGALAWLLLASVAFSLSVISLIVLLVNGEVFSSKVFVPLAAAAISLLCVHNFKSFAVELEEVADGK